MPQISILEGLRGASVSESVLSGSEQIKSIWDLGGLTWRRLLSRAWNGVLQNDLLNRAYELAYNFLLAVFPMLLFVLALLGARKTARRSVFLLAATASTRWLQCDRKHDTRGDEELLEWQADVRVVVRALRGIRRHDAVDIDAECCVRSTRRPIMDRGSAGSNRSHDRDVNPHHFGPPGGAGWRVGAATPGWRAGIKRVGANRGQDPAMDPGADVCCDRIRGHLYTLHPT